MYCLVVTDDFSRFSWVFFLATKDETSGILKAFIIGIENQINHRVKIIRCDNRTEFKNKEMNQFCEMKRIKREFSIVRTPQQNGNRVLVIKPHNKTPYELFLGRKPALSFMRPFGCPVTILNTLDQLVVAENQSNGNAGTKENVDASQAGKKTVPCKDYILLPLWTQDPPFSSNSKDSLDAGFKPSGEEEKKDESEASGKESKVPSAQEQRVNHEKDANANIINSINTVSSPVNAAGIEVDVVDENTVYGCADDLNIRPLEEIDYSNDNEDVVQRMT
ncbi:putative ribonuclease H-like domain-containing protein [Tanacetum coccineum]